MVKIKRLFSSILVLFVIFSVSNVYAVGSGSSISGGGFVGGGGGIVSNTAASRVLGNWGFKVSVVIGGKTKASKVYGNNMRDRNIGAAYGTTCYVDSAYSKVDLASGKRIPWTCKNKGGIAYINKIETNYRNDFSGTGLNWNSNTGSRANYVPLANYFNNLAKANGQQLYNYVKKAFGTSVANFTCENIDNAFLLVEPVLVVQLGSPRKKAYYGTVSEIAYIAETERYFGNLKSWAGQHSNLLRMPQNKFTYGDRNVSFNYLKGVGSSTKTTNNNTLARGKEGYGVGLIWLAGDEDLWYLCGKKCYSVKTTGNVAKCTNTNKPNVSTYSETITETECKGPNETKDATEYGRKVKTINSSCSVYCKESVTTSFPGNITPSKTLGTSFEWPTLKTGNTYDLNITGTRVCHVKVTGSPTQAELNQCANYQANANELYKDFQSAVKFEYNDPEYNRSNVQLEKVKDVTTCVQCNRAGSATKSSIEANEIKVQKSVQLSLPNKMYRYIDQQTKKSKDTKNSENDYDVGYGNLPISFKATAGKAYNLTLYDVKLGVGNVFGKHIANKTGNDKNYYTCKYTVTKDKTSECICPPGTDHSGEDLWCKIANSDGENCPTAIEKYCNDTGWTTTPLVCEDTPKYCDKPGYEHISIEACVNAGNSYNYCENKYCSGSTTPPVTPPVTPPTDPPGTTPPGSKYTCPKNDPSGGTYYMDITGCVEELLKKGYDETSAINACTNIVCPDSSDGKINIIYRTISLRNPFPSKQLNGGIAGFNLDVKGRYPGANWNSKLVVESAILNNRSVNNNDPESIYHETSGKKAKPLYTFVLSSKTMKDIRKYNEKQTKSGGYNDFTLTCYGKNSKGEKDNSECQSSFIKNRNYGIDISNSSCYGKTGTAFEACRKIS